MSSIVYRFLGRAIDKNKEAMCCVCGHYFNDILQGCLECGKCVKCLDICINPKTRRQIKVNGPTYDKLVESKVIIPCYHYRHHKEVHKKNKEIKKEKDEKDLKILMDTKEMILMDTKEITRLNRPVIDFLDTKICIDVTDIITSYLLNSEHKQYTSGYRYYLKDCAHNCGQWTLCCICNGVLNRCPSCK